MAAAATTLVPPIPVYKIALPSVGLGSGLLWFNLGLKAWSKESDTAPKVNGKGPFQSCTLFIMCRR